MTSVAKRTTPIREASPYQHTLEGFKNGSYFITTDDQVHIIMYILSHHICLRTTHALG